MGNIVTGDDILPSGDKLAGTGVSDFMTGDGGDDCIILRGQDDMAIGGDRADQFLFDGRYAGSGDMHRIADLDFAEGDTLLFRKFAAGMFDNSLDPFNWLAVRNSGGEEFRR